MSAPFDVYHRWLGIAPPDQPPHHYRFLGLTLYESDPEVIRDAAERQIAHVRNYQLGTHAELCQRVLNELAAAKACLLDPEKQAAYDAELRADLRRSGQPPILPPTPPSAPPVIPGARGWRVWVIVCLTVASLLGATAVCLLFLGRLHAKSGWQRPVKVAEVPELRPIPNRGPATVLPKSPAARLDSSKIASGETPTRKPSPAPSPPKITEFAPRSRDVPVRQAVPAKGVLLVPPNIPPPKAAEAKKEAANPQQQPDKRAQEVEARQKVAAIKEQEKQAILKRIYEQRSLLLRQLENATNSLRILNAQLTATNLEHGRLVQAASVVEQQAAALSQQAAIISSAPPDPDAFRLRQQNLGIIAIQYAACEDRYQSLEAAARRANSTRAGLLNQISGVNADTSRLRREAEQLRAEWLQAVDAYGCLKRGEFDRAIAIFGEWIVLESSNFEPYVARGVAYLQTGKKALAEEDFRAANRLAPRNAERMKQELQESLPLKGR